MTERTTVHVSGISSATTDKEVKDFFSFWYETAVHRDLLTSLLIFPIY